MNNPTYVALCMPTDWSMSVLVLDQPLCSTSDTCTINEPHLLKKGLDVMQSSLAVCTPLVDTVVII